MYLTKRQDKSGKGGRWTLVQDGLPRPCSPLVCTRGAGGVGGLSWPCLELEGDPSSCPVLSGSGRAWSAAEEAGGDRRWSLALGVGRNWRTWGCNGSELGHQGELGFLAGPRVERTWQHWPGPQAGRGLQGQGFRASVAGSLVVWCLW